VTPWQRFGRKSCALVLIVLFIFLTFLLYSALKSKAGQNKLKYPSSTNCASIGRLFERDLYDETTKKTVRKLDEAKFYGYAKHDQAATAQGSGAGYYQCFCTKHAGAKELSDNKVKKEKRQLLCGRFQADKTFGLALTNAVTVLVAVINIVIRTLNISLVDFIGYDTDSQRVSLVMLSVFWAQFVNTGIILLMTNANLRYSVLSMVPLRNQYPDLDKNWYLDIGPQLVKTMMIMAVYPWLEIFIFGGLKCLKRAMDKSCLCWETDRTKTTTTYNFIFLYSGPEYLMHFKYSSILTQVYISFMFGLFIPVLFPIAALGIANMYIVEKAGLLYYYRKPPMYDDKLQREALEVMKNAPIAMFVMGYWALGNAQIFFGKKSDLRHNNQVTDPLHDLFSTGDGLNQTHMIFAVLLAFAAKKFFHDFLFGCVKTCLQQCGFFRDEDVEGKDVEENIGSFWESLTGDDQKIWYANEVYGRSQYGISSVNDEALERLRKTDRRKVKQEKHTKKYIQGDSRYDILSNYKYQEQF